MKTETCEHCPHPPHGAAFCLRPIPRGDGSGVTGCCCVNRATQRSAVDVLRAEQFDEATIARLVALGVLR